MGGWVSHLAALESWLSVAGELPCNLKLLIEGEQRLSPLLRAGAALCTGGAAVYIAFLLLWGFNYRRVPMHERLMVADGLPDRAAVEKLLAARH